MDISSGNGYPESVLSNFSPKKFIFDNVLCNSIEGPLQAFKAKDPDVQKYGCTLVGIKAKSWGKKKKWWKDQTLHWQGKDYKRDSEEYQILLDRLYQAAYDQCEKFRKALEATKGCKLTHSIGKRKKSETVLTVQEFCSRLTKLRDTGKLI